MNTRSVGPNRRRKDRLWNAAAWIVLLALALPAFWIIMTAFRPNSEINTFPPVWIPRRLTLEAYANMFGLNPEVRQRVAVEAYLRNSLLASGISTVVAVSLGTLAGYAFARFRFRGHTSLFLGIMLSRAVPGVALSLPLFFALQPRRLGQQCAGLGLRLCGRQHPLHRLADGRLLPPDSQGN